MERLMENSTPISDEAAAAAPTRKTRRKPALQAPTPIRHIDQDAVAQRWSVSPRTLERWRWIGTGPRFLKIGGRVVYRVEDIEAYEAAQLRTSTLPVAPVNGGAR
jgi:hypothetical protein